MRDMSADLDEATHAQVARLLGPERAAEMLGLLGGSLTKLSGMPEAELAAPMGLALVHRLKSEAGLMGFDRLSQACDAVDAAGSHSAVSPEDLAGLRQAIASALAVVETLNERRTCPTT